MLRKSLTFSYSSLKEYLKSLNPELSAQLECYQERDLPKIVFAAIDNDLLHKADFIKQILLKKSDPHYFPIIGECALSTYLATNHYKGKKSLILRDCLALIDLCDEFFIFIENAGVKNHVEAMNQLAEGVLFELAYWFNKHPRANVQIINISNPCKLQSMIINIDDMKLIENRNFKDQVESTLTKQLKNPHPTLYLACANKHFKFVDWFRKDAFNHRTVPVNANALVSTSNLMLILDYDTCKQFLYRAALAKKCEKICIYGPVSNNQLFYKDIELEVLFELFLILQFKKNNAMLNEKDNTSPTLRAYYKSFNEVNIPKYRNKSQWAITTQETKDAMQERKNTAVSKSIYGVFSLKKDIKLKDELKALVKASL